MLPIVIKPDEIFNEETGEFIRIKGQTLQLEHSLISLSKWESKWHKPFMDSLEKGKLTIEETIDYIKCMTLNSKVDENLYLFINNDIMSQISKYLSDPMTATTFNETNSKRDKKIITSEVIYSSMISLGIPFECEKWHLNRLLTLIKVCNIENQPSKKMSKKEITRNNAAINAARRRQMNTRG